MTTNSTSQSAPVKVKIASTGDVLDVPDDKSILLVLIENGYLVESSCTAGLCGMCRVRYLKGEVDHKDYILTDQEKSEYLTTCISRPTSPELVLDLPPPGTAPSETMGIEGIMKACPKLLMNGPCGGSENGMCEVDTSIPCVWAKSWDNAKELGLLDMLNEVQPPKNWSVGRMGAGAKSAAARDNSSKGAEATPAKPETEPEPVAADSDAGDREDAFLRDLGLA
ncbi:MAG: methylenetetrahydrofolate reductase C-terminal domain-containing protein [Methyloligellaceae bacterium]